MDQALTCCEGDTKVEIVGDLDYDGDDNEDDEDETADQILDALGDIVYDEENADVLTDMHEANIKKPDSSGEDM